jgi:transcriptional regulator with XRE-family HTH domain
MSHRAKLVSGNAALAFRLRVAIWRELKGVTQAELARRAGVSQCTISKIESGATSPAIDVVDAIAKVMGVRLSKVFR